MAVVQSSTTQAIYKPGGPAESFSENPASIAGNGGNIKPDYRLQPGAPVYGS